MYVFEFVFLGLFAAARGVGASAGVGDELAKVMVNSPAKLPARQLMTLAALQPAVLVSVVVQATAVPETVTVEALLILPFVAATTRLSSCDSLRQTLPLPPTQSTLQRTQTTARVVVVSPASLLSLLRSNVQ